MVPSKRLEIAWHHFLIPSAALHLAVIYAVAPLLSVRPSIVSVPAPSWRRPPAAMTSFIEDEPPQIADVPSPDDDPFAPPDAPPADFLDHSPQAAALAPKIPLPRRDADAAPSVRNADPASVHAPDTLGATAPASPPLPLPDAPGDQINPTAANAAPAVPASGAGGQSASNSAPHAGKNASGNASARNGSAAGGSAQTAPGAAQNDAWRLYAKQLSAHFKKFKNYPPMAQRLKLTGTVWIRLELRRDGMIVSAQIDKSSGHKILDDAALAAARSAQPLPPFPPQIAAQTRNIRIPYQFALSD